jgi:hypothetical protein
MAAVFEDSGVTYAAIDLDWIGWFDAGWDDESASFAVMVRNLAAMVSNYLDAGVRYVVMALSIKHDWEREAIRSVVPQPMHVVRLESSMEVIRARLSSNPTVGRQGDLAAARRWLESGVGVGLEDFTVDSDRRVRDVVNEILHSIEWEPTQN